MDDFDYVNNDEHENEDDFAKGRGLTRIKTLKRLNANPGI